MYSGYSTIVQELVVKVFLVARLKVAPHKLHFKNDILRNIAAWCPDTTGYKLATNVQHCSTQGAKKTC